MLRRLSIITATVGARASLRRLSGRPSSSSLIEETKHLMNLTQQLRDAGAARRGQGVDVGEPAAQA